MFTNKLEEKFFLSHLMPNHHLLEYGSGESTIQISNIVNSMVSIEHQKIWYNNIKSQITNNNCKIILKEPDLSYTEGKECGSYDQFFSYINEAQNYGPYDIILIDGRARVSCAKLCPKISHTETLIFVHDWDRQEYQEISQYLNFIEAQDTMAKFRIKF